MREGGNEVAPALWHVGEGQTHMMWGWKQLSRNRQRPRVYGGWQDWLCWRKKKYLIIKSKAGQEIRQQGRIFFSFIGSFSLTDAFIFTVLVAFSFSKLILYPLYLRSPCGDRVELFMQIWEIQLLGRTCEWAASYYCSWKPSILTISLLFSCCQLIRAVLCCAWLNFIVEFSIWDVENLTFILDLFTWIWGQASCNSKSQMNCEFGSGNPIPSSKIIKSLAKLRHRNLISRIAI